MFSLPGKELEGNIWSETGRGRGILHTASRSRQKKQRETDFYRGEETQIQQAHWETDWAEELGKQPRISLRIDGFKGL